MGNAIVLAPPARLARLGFEALPAVIEDAGDGASRRFIEFFTANIRNRTDGSRGGRDRAAGYENEADGTRTRNLRRDRPAL